MLTLLLTVQCLPWLVPCLTGRYFTQPEIPVLEYVFQDQVTFPLIGFYNILSQYANSDISPQYEPLERSPRDLDDLEIELRKASADHLRKERSKSNIRSMYPLFLPLH